MDEVKEKAIYVETAAPVIENIAEAVKPDLADLSPVDQEAVALSGNEVEQLIQADTSGAA